MNNPNEKAQRGYCGFGYWEKSGLISLIKTYRKCFEDYAKN